ncbi:hypothetical protein TrST_g6255 [Triparma strigata]|uniref:MaoC-like domain-containing protein n=1 Tax=Triparma strigata TaxID=1606541 RepID=A0A9W7EYX2_9STRA|nr:hypothetical protein TrST_g6255 [Triparma strigata]
MSTPPSKKQKTTNAPPFLGPNLALGGVSVGDTASYTRLITEDHVIKYSEITGDINPLHFNKTYAESTIFKSLITHGGIQAGILNALVAQELPGPGSVFMEQNLKYKKPVKVGDVLTAHGKVINVHKFKPICNLEVEVTAKRGEEVIVVLTGDVAVFRATPIGEDKKEEEK